MRSDLPPRPRSGSPARRLRDAGLSVPAALLLSLLCLLLLPAPVRAQDASFNLGVQSDYAVRGVSQTDGQPSVFGGADATLGQVYVGTWASNVSFPGDSDTNTEIDLYAGWRTTHGDWTFEGGAIAYLYAGQAHGADYNFVEAKLAASRTRGAWTVGGVVYASPDFFGAGEDEAVYVEASTAVKLTPKIAVSGALGRQTVSSDFDYTTWNAGVTFSLTEQVALDIRGWDTDRHDFGDPYAGRVVAAVKATF